MSGSDFLDEGNFLVVKGCVSVDKLSDWAEDFTDHIVARIAIKAEHDKVKSSRDRLIGGDSVESKVFIVDGVGCLADDPGFDLVQI